MLDAEGVQPDSPAGAEGAADSSAGTENTDQAGATGQQQTVPYSRFSQVNGEWRTLQGQHAALQGNYQSALQQIERMQAAARPPEQAPSKEFIEAGDALLKILESHPKLKSLLGLAEAAPRLMEGYDGVQALTAAQKASVARQGQGELASFAKSAGLPSDNADFMGVLEDTVAAIIRRLPDGLERLRAGDTSVVKEAFTAYQKSYLTPMQRGTSIQTAATKSRLAQLPPAPRGGLPGEPAPPALTADNGQQFKKSMHGRAATLLERLRG